MREEQTVLEMAEEVLLRQARALGAQTGQPLERALEAVSDTDAGRQLGALAKSHYRLQRAARWQASLLSKRVEQRRGEQYHYSWLESYIGWLEGKEDRAQYHGFLEEELARLKGWHSELRTTSP